MGIQVGGICTTPVAYPPYRPPPVSPYGVAASQRGSMMNSSKFTDNVPEVMNVTSKETSRNVAQRNCASESGMGMLTHGAESQVNDKEVKRVEHEVEIEALKRERETLKKCIEDLTIENRALEGKVNELTRQLDSEKSERSIVERDLVELQKRVTNERLVEGGENAQQVNSSGPGIQNSAIFEDPSGGVMNNGTVDNKTKEADMTVGVNSSKLFLESSPPSLPLPLPPTSSSIPPSPSVSSSSDSDSDLTNPDALGPARLTLVSRRPRVVQSEFEKEDYPTGKRIVPSNEVYNIPGTFPNSSNEMNEGKSQRDANQMITTAITRGIYEVKLNKSDIKDGESRTFSESFPSIEDFSGKVGKSIVGDEGFEDSFVSTGSTGMNGDSDAGGGGQVMMGKEEFDDAGGEFSGFEDEHLHEAMDVTKDQAEQEVGKDEFTRYSRIDMGPWSTQAKDGGNNEKNCSRPVAPQDWDAIFGALTSTTTSDTGFPTNGWACEVDGMTSVQQSLEINNSNILTNAHPSKQRQGSAGKLDGMKGKENSIDDPMLARLVDMGFKRDEALKALESHDYNFDAALDFVMDASTNKVKNSTTAAMATTTSGLG